MSPEEQYRRLRDPDRWTGIAAPESPHSAQAGSPLRRSRGLLAVRIAVAAVIVAGASAILLATSTLGGAAPAHPTPSVSATTPIGTVVRTVPVPTRPYAYGIAAAATASAFYFATLGPKDDTWSITRVDAVSGATTTRTQHLPGLHELTAGPDGLYVATSIEPNHVPAGTPPDDTIERLDSTTLRVLADVSLPTGSVYDSDVELAAGGAVLVETDGGGSVRLLDPDTLAIRKTVQLLSRARVQAGDTVQRPVLENPASDGGRVWVAAGGRFDALDLATLHTLVSVPQQGYRLIVPGGDGLRVLGDATGRLADDGTITEDSPQGLVDPEHPVGAAAATDAGVLERVGGGGAAMLVLQQGDVPPTSGLELTSQGELLAGAGRYAWVTGVPGSGTAISEVRLSGSASDATASPAPTATRVQSTFRLPGTSGIVIAPASTLPAVSPAQALSLCGGDAACGTGRPQQLLLGLVTSQHETDRLAYVLRWTVQTCVPTGGPPTAPGRSAAPVTPTPCEFDAVIDATTGAPLFSVSYGTKG